MLRTYSLIKSSANKLLNQTGHGDNRHGPDAAEGAASKRLHRSGGDQRHVRASAVQGAVVFEAGAQEAHGDRRHGNNAVQRRLVQGQDVHRHRVRI